MKINLALEWFLNPDHIPFIVGIKNGYYADVGIELNIITPNEHYDGFNALKKGEIEMAINEPLHLIEQFDENMLSLGNFFETDGGVLLSEQGLQKLLSGQKIKISSPVSNEITNKIAVEILRRYASKKQCRN
jgi:ABC-type nitrate/sulfonate/bicarbonate transport system substrate-binding protein